MAICWVSGIGRLDTELVFAPERYSARRNAHLIESDSSVPMSDVVRLLKTTVNASQSDPYGQFVVLDTTHAVEGRIQFRGGAVKGSDVGSVKRPLDPGHVVISRLRTYLRQVALVDEDFFDLFGAAIVCSTEFYVLESIDPKADIAFLVPFLLSDPVQEIFKNAQEGGHHPRIHASTVMELRLPIRLFEERERVSAQVRLAAKTARQAEAIFVKCSDVVRALT